MSESFENLEILAHQITDLSDRDLHRLARLVVRGSPPGACDLLDGIQGEFSLVAAELEL